jgi:hypothetical protein
MQKTKPNAPIEITPMRKIIELPSRKIVHLLKVILSHIESE